MTTDLVISGLKVLDVASYIAGPAAATVLSRRRCDQGRVAEMGHTQRYLSSFPPSRRASTNLNGQIANRNRRWMTLDLKSSGGAKYSNASSNGPRWSLSISHTLPARRRLRRSGDVESKGDLCAMSADSVIQVQMSSFRASLIRSTQDHTHVRCAMRAHAASAVIRCTKSWLRNITTGVTFRLVAVTGGVVTNVNCPSDAGDAARVTGRVHHRYRVYATMWRGPAVAAISPTDVSKFRRGTGVAGG
jgi:hypothetical protein